MRKFTGLVTGPCIVNIAKHSPRWHCTETLKAVLQIAWHQVNIFQLPRHCLPDKKGELFARDIYGRKYQPRQEVGEASSVIARCRTLRGRAGCRSRWTRRLRRHSLRCLCLREGPRVPPLRSRSHHPRMHCLATATNSPTSFLLFYILLVYLSTK